MSGKPPPSAQAARLRADLALLLVATIWGFAFVAQRAAATQSGVFWFNGLRFLLGALVLLPLSLRSRWRSAVSELPGVLLAGLLLFSASALQQMGLQYTTAGNAGFITGLYVVLIPLLLAVVWRQQPRPAIWVASLLATAGLFLLSTGGSFKLAPGDALELAGAFVWALHVLWIGRLVQRVEVLPLAIGQYLICSILSLGTALGIGEPRIFASAGVWIAVLYTGIFSIGMGYTLQAVGQRLAPPSDAAILLSLEAPFAALSGWLLLDEKLSTIQLFGCGLMLAGMLLAQVPAFRDSRSKRTDTYSI